MVDYYVFYENIRKENEKRWFKWVIRRMCRLFVLILEILWNKYNFKESKEMIFFIILIVKNESN